MAIHFENYKTFSKGQGFIGVACRTKSPQASTPRLFACDCLPCKQEVLMGKMLISRAGEVGVVAEVFTDRVELRRESGNVVHFVTMAELDTNWAPLDIDAIFGVDAQ